MSGDKLELQHGEALLGSARAAPNASQIRSRVAISEISLTILAAACILLHLAIRFLTHLGPAYSDIPLYIALGLGGLPLLWSLGRGMLHLEFGSDLLAGVSNLAAVITGQYLVGVVIVLMFSGGRAL